jgi:hypothetical protein
MELLKQLSKNAVKIQVEETTLVERPLTDEETDKKEEIVHSLKSKYKEFRKKYGKDAKSVMYATATKLAKEDTPINAEPLNEERASSTLELMSAIKGLPMVDKIVDVHFMRDGSTALIRTKDGNAYEIQIRQAGMGQNHDQFTKRDQYKERVGKRTEKARQNWFGFMNPKQEPIE